ncbi:MAG: alpha/beta hydrolase family protein [Xanthobacteraceae bacterium]
MARDPQVDLIFSHFTPRYIATGVDPNDLDRLIDRIERWDDWCRIWSEEAAQHEQLADDAKSLGRVATATEAYLRASIMYHYGKHLFADRAEEYSVAQAGTVRCYRAAMTGFDPPIERIEFPFEGVAMAGYLRRPAGRARPPVAVILPGLDACKEELHAWADAFVKRGVATVTLDGPGQGETAEHMPVRPDWGRVLGAVIDVLARRDDVNGRKVGVVGQSLGALYAPLAAAGEPRLKACIANCGPFDWGAVLPKMPKVSQIVFRVRSRASSDVEMLAIARRFTLDRVAQNIKCPLLVVFGGGDRLIAPSEGERLAGAASGPVTFVLYEEGNHVCFNIPYKFRPLTADWMAETLA